MIGIPMTLVIALVVLLGGCESTKHAKDVQESGFLAEHRHLLKSGIPGVTALRVYRNPKADWASYHKIILEPVTIWDDPSARLSPEQHKDLQQLVDSFYDTLYLKLSKDYEMVEKPGPGTMRIRAAITHGEEARTGLTLISKAVPQLRAPNALWTFASGKPAFAGEVTLEAIITDAETGELLAAGADRRVGGVNLFDKEVFNSWGDVKNSLEFWSDASVYRLCVLRGGTNCTKPKA